LIQLHRQADAATQWPGAGALWPPRERSAYRCGAWLGRLSVPARDGMVAGVAAWALWPGCAWIV